jgi:hypothetical protein
MVTAANWLQLHVLEADVLIQCDDSVLLRSPGEAVFPFNHHVAQPGVAAGYIALVLCHLGHKLFSFIDGNNITLRAVSRQLAVATDPWQMEFFQELCSC